MNAPLPLAATTDTAELAQQWLANLDEYRLHPKTLDADIHQKTIDILAKKTPAPATRPSFRFYRRPSTNPLAEDDTDTPGPTIELDVGK